MSNNEPKNLKWEGKATTELQSTKAEQVWPLLEDFCNLHKWLPAINTCHYVQGVHGQPGLVRYCATIIPSSTPSNDTDNAPKTVVKWCHEKLLSLDPVQRCLSYEIGENNLGFTAYVAKMKVVDVDSCGCVVEWSFVADPVEGMSLEDFCGYLESSLKAMAERMEKELQSATN